MKAFALALTAGAVTALSNIEIKFMNYLTKHGKQYATIEEFVERVEYFANVDRAIEESNTVEKNFTLGHNRMSDWSPAEKAVLRGGKYHPADKRVKTVWFEETESSSSLKVDWNAKGAVTPVKD